MVAIILLFRESEGVDIGLESVAEENLQKIMIT